MLIEFTPTNVVSLPPFCNGITATTEPGSVLDEGRVPAFLVGGKDLALDGLKILLARHNISIGGGAARLQQLEIPFAYRATRFFVVIDVVNDVDGIAQEISTVRDRFAQACIVVLIDPCQKSIGTLSHKFGANAVLDRNIGCEALILTLRVALAGYGVLSPAATIAVDVRNHELESELARPTGLSDREIDVLGCIAEGHSNKVIARRFAISEATVKIHVRGILRKIDVRNRTQAAIWALQRGLGSPTPEGAD